MHVIIWIVVAVSPVIVIAAFVTAIKAALTSPVAGRAARVVSGIVMVASGSAVGCGAGTGLAAAACKVAFPNPSGDHGLEGLAALVFTALGGFIGVELGAVSGAWWATQWLAPAKAKMPDVIDEP
jgi:hypothetical protein